MCKCIIDGCYSCDKLDDFANNSLVEILQLFHNLEELKMENRFNPEIKYFNSKTQKVEKYTFNNLKDEVNKYLQEHPEYQINTYANNEFISKSNDWVDYFLDNEKREILMDGWDLKINDDIEDEVNISLKESKDYFKTINVEVLLEKLGHTFKLIGKKSFVGYISYINNNGNVFLKRIYDVKGNSKNDVLYFMDIDKLIELTTMEKNEIDRYLSSTNNIELKRFYYSPILEQKILSFYSNISYDDMEKDIKKFINIAKKRKEKQER